MFVIKNTHRGNSLCFAQEVALIRAQRDAAALSQRHRYDYSVTVKPQTIGMRAAYNAATDNNGGRVHGCAFERCLADLP